MQLRRFSKILIIVLLAIFSFSLFISSAMADKLPSLVPPDGGNCEGAPPGTVNCGDYGLNDFIQIAVNISQIILGIVGSLALLMFIYAGFWMIIFGGNSQEIEKAKNTIKNAIIGLIIVFASWAIINLVITALVCDKDKPDTCQGTIFGNPWSKTPK